MRGLGYRGLRIVVLGGGSVALYVVLEPLGYGWVVLPVLLGAVAVVFLVTLFRARKGRRYHRWTDALIDGEKRAVAVREIRAERDTLDLKSEGGLSGYVHLSILLGELTAVGGDNDGADAILVELTKLKLEPGVRARVQYTRAALALRAGEMDRAEARLDDIGVRVGDPALDLRVELLRAVIDIEAGRTEAALETAQRVRKAKAADDSLVVEARTVRAAALDAMGQTKDAQTILRALGPEVRPVLIALGHPRIVRLARATKGS